MNNKRLTAVIAVVAILCFSCNNRTPETNNVLIADNKDKGIVNMESPYKDEEQKYIDTDSIGDKKQNVKEIKQTEDKSKPDWDKKIIKTASLNVEVKEYAAFSVSLREKVKAAGGYIAQEEQTQSDYKIENTIVIKVPVDQFDNASTSLVNNVEKVNEKKITSQDVTTDMIDTKSRMEAKKQVRLRYMDLLKQAKNMEEILNVQSEINSIQEEIESASGRIQYLGNSAAYSTINLTYYQVVNSSAKENETPSFFKKIGSAFKLGGAWIVDLMIAMVAVWPLFLLAAIIFLLYRKLKKKLVKPA